ncbi:helix-turn-helix transcriptional regulator [Halarchaeum sp. CBA1220]|nr:helix-turn-helix transcriptional regulator [Halarchaeum sp. CBA1220]
MWDDRILEYLRECETGTATEMKQSGYFSVSLSQLSRRLSKLADHDLVRHLGNGVYSITDEGEAYLNEEYDAEAGAYVNSEAENESSTAETEVNGA